MPVNVDDSACVLHEATEGKTARVGNGDSWGRIKMPWYANRRFGGTGEARVAMSLSAGTRWYNVQYELRTMLG